MDLKILGTATDQRTSTRVVYAQLPISDYLDLVGPEFHNFEIQRRREKHKAYARMKQDIKMGALLPSITLAVIPDKVPTILPLLDPIDEVKLRNALSVPGQVNILDGLQRTYILNDLKEEGVRFREGQCVLLEFWLEHNIQHLIYRIIVLNAGQKPMSMRHQVELLFMTLKDKLQNEIQIEIYKEKDQTRRRKSRKYSLDHIVTAYQSFLNKSPEVKRENIVAQTMLDDSILDSSEDELGNEYTDFTKYFNVYTMLDDEVWRIYSANNPPSSQNWLGQENVMNSFFAAVADFGSTDERKKRISVALEHLLDQCKTSDESDDPLELVAFTKIIGGLNIRRVNIGAETRRVLFVGFKEYFREEGSRPLSDCWLEAAR